MYTKQDIEKQLKEAGLKKSDIVMIHSSMKAIGDVFGGADTVIDAFMDYFSEGMVMVPTHTWKQMSSEYNTFDPKKEESCVGIITNLFMKRDGVYRSLHPTHSIAAFGKGAKDYVRFDDDSFTPCNPKGCFGRLKDINAKILLIGVTHAKNTFIHSIEEAMDIKERLTDKPIQLKVVTEQGIKKVDMYRHYNQYEAHISETFDKLGQRYYDEGVAWDILIGDAKTIVCDAYGLYNVTTNVLEKEPDYFIRYSFNRSQNE